MIKERKRAKSKKMMLFLPIVAFFSAILGIIIRLGKISKKVKGK